MSTEFSNAFSSPSPVAFHGAPPRTSPPFSWSPLEYDHSDLQVLCSNADFMSFFFQHIASCPPRGPFRYYSALTFVTRARERYAPFPGNPHHHLSSALPRGANAAMAPDQTHMEATKTGTISSSFQPTNESTIGANRGTSIPPPPTLALEASQSILSTSSGSSTGTGGTDGTTMRMVVCSAERLYNAINLQNILALMEQKFATSHLSTWPLFYVLSGVHSSDVVKLIAQQQEEIKMIKEPSEVPSQISS